MIDNIFQTSCHKFVEVLEVKKLLRWSEGNPRSFLRMFSKVTKGEGTLSSKTLLHPSKTDFFLKLLIISIFAWYCGTNYETKGHKCNTIFNTYYFSSHFSKKDKLFGNDEWMNDEWWWIYNILFFLLISINIGKAGKTLYKTNTTMYWTKWPSHIVSNLDYKSRSR